MTSEDEVLGLSLSQKVYVEGVALLSMDLFGGGGITFDVGPGAERLTYAQV